MRQASRHRRGVAKDDNGRRGLPDEQLIGRPSHILERLMLERNHSAGTFEIRFGYFDPCHVISLTLLRQSTLL
eukprot:5283943-Pleurochrysis_carterae.AAC.6